MPDLRIVFLVLLVASVALIYFRSGTRFDLAILPMAILDTLLVPALLGTLVVFFLLMLKVEPEPLYLQAISWLSRHTTVSFIEAIPAELHNSMEVASVKRQNTDDDEFQEWLVFYRSELQPGVNPIQPVIYDNDRGNPPIIYPYPLVIPGHNMLGGASLGLAEVTQDKNGLNGADLQELLVTNGAQLAIFRFDQNSKPWDMPLNNPPRYRPLGYFEGTGGVSFSGGSKNVEVIDHNRFDRSQLGWRSVYALNSARGIQPSATEPDSYWQPQALGDEELRLAEPIMSTVDFLTSPPPDIFNTEFPEKIVLAFYASTCSQTDNTLCRSKDEDWSSVDFLAQDGDAVRNFRSSGGGNSYFGLDSLNATQNLQVKNVQYFPNLESPAGSCVAIEFQLNNSAREPLAYKVGQVAGQWKIEARLPLAECVADLSQFTFNDTPNTSFSTLPPLGDSRSKE